MPTSVHIPKPVLEAVDRRARALKMSRNRFILEALRKELAHGTQWTPGFFDELGPLSGGDAAAVDEMLHALHIARTAKAPTQL